MTATAASLGLTAHQFGNLLGIVRAVQARALPIKAAYITVEAALDESDMQMYASANVPASQHYPHVPVRWEPDGLGHDHASMGMLQQQTGYAWTPAGYGRAMNQTTIDTPNGWGTPAELMNPQVSTAKFLNVLAAHSWRSMTNWVAAQAVQGSAYPDGSNYRAQDARAQRYVNAVWAVTPAVITMKETDMIIYRVLDMPQSGRADGGAGGGNVFTFDGQNVAQIFSSASALNMSADLGRPITSLSALRGYSYSQHMHWVDNSPRGHV